MNSTRNLYLVVEFEVFPSNLFRALSLVTLSVAFCGCIQQTLNEQNERLDSALVKPELLLSVEGSKSATSANYWNNSCRIIDALNELDTSSIGDKTKMQGGNRMLVLRSKVIFKTAKWLDELPREGVDDEVVEVVNEVIYVYSEAAAHIGINDGGVSDGELALDGAIAGAKAWINDNPGEVLINELRAWPNIVKKLESIQEKMNRVQSVLQDRYQADGLNFAQAVLY